MPHKRQQCIQVESDLRGGPDAIRRGLVVLQAEVKAMAERNGKGMNLGLKQVNAVLRL